VQRAILRGLRVFCLTNSHWWLFELLERHLGVCTAKKVLRSGLHGPYGAIELVGEWEHKSTTIRLRREFVSRLAVVANAISSF